MTARDRLKTYLSYKKIKDTEFIEAIGASKGYIQSMSKGFGPKYEDIVRYKFPDLNIGWLITGDGEMLNGNMSDTDVSNPKISSGKVIPYYDAEVAAGTQYGMEMAPAAPAGWIEIGGILKDSEFAMRVYGNSMVPNYPAGCVIGLRRYTEHFIEPGTVYVIETAENRFLKRLYYNDDKTAFSCISDNHMKHESGPREGKYFYPEFEIPLEDVKKLFRVTGVIKRNIM